MLSSPAVLGRWPPTILNRSSGAPPYRPVIGIAVLKIGARKLHISIGGAFAHRERWPAAMAPHLPRASGPFPTSIAAASWALHLNAPSARGNISGQDRQAVTHDTGSRRLPKLVSETSRPGRTTLSDSIKTPSALPSVASSTSAIALSSGASRIW